MPQEDVAVERETAAGLSLPQTMHDLTDCAVVCAERLLSSSCDVFVQNGVCVLWRVILILRHKQETKERTTQAQKRGRLAIWQAQQKRKQAGPRRKKRLGLQLGWAR